MLNNQVSYAMFVFGSMSGVQPQMHVYTELPGVAADYFIQLL